MAKSKESTALAEMPQEDQELANLPDNAFGESFNVEGREEKGDNLSRVVLYNGTQEEEEMYGQHPRGMFLDALEVKELGTSINVMPIALTASYALWEEGKRIPTQQWKNQSEVPEEYLKWTEDAGGKPIPPQVQESVIMLCCVQFVDPNKNNAEPEVLPFPFNFTFKSTGLAAFERQIKLIENRRRITGKKTPGLYQLTSKPDKNAAGKPFQRLVATFKGEPPAEMAKLGAAVYAARKRLLKASQEQEQEAESRGGGEEGGFDPNAE